MKKVCSLLIAVAILLSMIPFSGVLRSRAESENTVEAVKGTPTVDGNLSDWSGVKEKYYLNNRVLDGSAQTTGYFQVMWDADYLYIAGEIYDVTNDGGNDQLKVLFDIDGVPVGDDVVAFADRPNAGVHTNTSINYNPNGGANAWNPLNAWNGYLNPGNNVVTGYDTVIQYVQGESKYVIESKWHPTDAMKAKLTSGSSFGFDIQWSDYNKGSYADDPKITNIGWSSALVDWNNDLRTIGELKLVGQDVPAGAQEYIANTDNRLSYLGRWKAEGSVMVSYWNSPSVSFDFTGNTLKIDLAKKSSIAVELDGVVTTYYKAEGTMNIPVSGSGSHTVKVYGPGMHLKGFYVAEGATVAKTPEKPYYAMFIGDSISEDLRSGTFNAGRLAGWDWTVYALGGIALSDGNGYYTGTGSGWGYYNSGYYAQDLMAGWDGTTRIGMESAFFNYERPIDKASNFTSYTGFAQERQPDAIFIALGVNDYLQNQAQSQEFVNDYVAFVKKLCQYYPDATIYIAQALGDNNTGLRQTSIAKAAKEICNQDANVVFLSNTPAWGIEISSDGVHPSEAGYAKLTQKLQGILESYAQNGGPEQSATNSGVADYGSVFVDGNLTEWGNAEKYPLNQRVVDGSAQTTGWYQIKWDENGIYVGGQITDATKDASNDIIKILLDFDGQPQKSATLNFVERTNAGVFSWQTWGYCGNDNDPKNPNPFNPVNAWGGSLPAGNDVLGDGQMLNEYVWSYSDGCYTFELLLVPTEALKSRLVENAELGFDIRWVDHNNAESFESTKNTTIGWASDELDWNVDLSKIGSIKLVKTGTGNQPGEEPENVAVARNDTPKVDGKLTEWDDEQAYDLSKRVINGDANTTGWFKMKWDSKGIYVAGRIEDATKDPNNDIVKFLFDFEGVATGDDPVRFYNRNQAGAYSWMTWGYNGYGTDTKNPAPWNPLNAWCNNLSSGMDVIGDTVNDHKYEWKYVDGGYEFEIAIYPSEGMKQKLAIGSKIGFDIQWVDHNNATSSADGKVTTIGWMSENVDWGDDLRTIGWVKFADGPRNTPPEDVPYKPAYTKPEANAYQGSATVDGELKEWATDNKYELTQKIDGTAINTGWYKIKWDSNAIYIGGQITDATEDGNNDLVKVVFDFDGRANSYQLIDFSKRPNAGAHAWQTWGYSGGGTVASPIAWSPLNAFGIQSPAGTAVIGDGSSANSFVWQYKDGAYNFEMVLYPSDAMKEKLVAGAQIGFDIQWVDHNNAGSAQDGKVTTIGWASPYADWNTDLCSLGLVTLMNAPDIKPMEATDGVGAIQEPKVTSTSITMTWSATENADTYLINLFALDQDDYIFMRADSVTSEELVITKLEPNGNYAVQVIALDADAVQMAVYPLVDVTTLLYDEGGSEGSVLINVTKSDSTNKPAEPIGKEQTQNGGNLLVIFVIAFTFVAAAVATACILLKVKKKKS